MVRLGIPDGQAANMIFAIVMKLLPLLEPDDVIVTTWSLDGHPDHEATSEAARQASTKAGCRLIEAPVWMWHWATPDDFSIPWSRLVWIDHPGHVQALKRRLCHTTRANWKPGVAGLTRYPCLMPGGVILACHWRHSIQACVLNGVDIHDALRHFIRLSNQCHVQEPGLQLDVWSSGPTMAQKEGIF